MLSRHTLPIIIGVPAALTRAPVLMGGFAKANRFRSRGAWRKSVFNSLASASSIELQSIGIEAWFAWNRIVHLSSRPALLG